MPVPPQNAAAFSGDCDLHSAHRNIKHMIYIQFDNIHFTRDNPNVPSDLEQMPHLLNFFVKNGTFSTNHHTPLIATLVGGLVLAFILGALAQRMRI